MFISNDVELLDVEIGSGSFAKVYKGKKGLETVAVKVVKRGKLNAKILEALESEINIQSSIKHQHLVNLLGIIRDPESIYLVMEYCDLGDLSVYIKRNFPLQETVVLNFISQLSRGIEFLRLNSLIHRDIKPQNILLSSSKESELPVLKIGDFGFARALPIASMADTLCGSPLYMAPEILKGEKYDAKSDLWSLGAVFFEMVTAKPPFRASNHIELLRKIEARDGPKWTNVQVSDAIKDLISRLLKKNPVERMAFEEFFLHPCLMGTTLLKRAQTPPRKASEQERTSVSVLEGDPPFPGYGVDSKIFEALKSSKAQENEKYDFVHIKPVSSSVKWVDETPKVAASLFLPCPWRGESIIDVFTLSQSDEGMIIVFGLRISCLDDLIFGEFKPSADSPYEWSIVLDLCLLSLDLYQTCLDYCRSYFKSHKSISKDLKELCSWIVSRTSALIQEAEHASSLIPDEVDWDPPLVLQYVLDKISSSLNAKPPPSSVMILSCLVNLVLCDAYCQSIAARHSSEFMDCLTKHLRDLSDVAQQEAKLALAKKKLQEFQAKKLQPSESVDNFVDLYKESTAASPVIPAAADTKTEDDWIENWVKKVNSLKSKEQAASVSFKPVLTALGVSTNVVDALEFNNSLDMQVSPVKLEEIGLPVIPDVEHKADPVEYQNELLNKIKILNEAVEKLKNNYLEETSKRKIMENTVAQITSSMVKGLEQVEEERKRLKGLLEESNSEKNKVKSQMQDLIKKNQELTEEIFQKSQKIVVPNVSEIELKLEQVTQELFAAKKTSEGLRHTLDVKQTEWIRKEKDHEDSIRSIEMERASVSVLKANVENMKFSAEEELKKALDLKSELIELQNKLYEEKKELESKAEYLEDAQRILDSRVQKIDQMSQAKDLTIQQQFLDQNEAIELMRKRLEEEKDEIAKERAFLKEKEKLFNVLEEKERAVAIKEASIYAKEMQLADKESDLFKKEKIVLDKIQNSESNKSSVKLEQEMRLRQEELTKSIKSFNDFKDQLETSMKEREAKFSQKVQQLENEKNENIKKHALETKNLEEKIKKLEDQIISSPKKSMKSIATSFGNIAEREALEQEKSIISEIKTKTKQESQFVKEEKARILEEANQLEKEWMAVRLKEAEITKAMADISVAAAQQAVGSSISTAETLISRDQMRELEFENRELVKENEDLKAKIANQNSKDKIQAVNVSPLFKSPDLKGIQHLESPIIADVSPELNEVIVSLTQSNQDLKHRIEYLVKAFEEKNIHANHTGISNGQTRPSSRMNDAYIRKTHRPIADPRLIQSALGNPIAIAYPNSPELGPSIYSRPQIIPTLKHTPPRPLSTDFYKRPDTSNSIHSISAERKDIKKESPGMDLFIRSETNHSNYSVPADRKDVVKELDAQISAQIHELNQIFGESSPLSKKANRTGPLEESPKKKAGTLNDNEKERIRELVKQRIKDKKTAKSS